MTPAMQVNQVRVWIVQYADWQPQTWADMPPAAIALEPAEEAPMSPLEARSYVEGFNEAALANQDGRWAVAVPVRTCFEGDLKPGEPLPRVA